MREQLRKPDRNSLDLAVGLHELLAKDPTWRDDVLALALSPKPEVRTVGLSLLRELGCGDALQPAQQSGYESPSSSRRHGAPAGTGRPQWWHEIAAADIAGSYGRRGLRRTALRSERPTTPAGGRRRGGRP